MSSLKLTAHDNHEPSSTGNRAVFEPGSPQVRDSLRLPQSGTLAYGLSNFTLHESESHRCAPSREDGSISTGNATKKASVRVYGNLTVKMKLGYASPRPALYTGKGTKSCCLLRRIWIFALYCLSSGTYTVALDRGQRGL